MDFQDNRKRRPYPSAAQKAKLISRLESDTDLSNGKYSSTFSKNEAERRWSDIADELNSIPGPTKTWMEWRKTWQDMKCSTKRKSTGKRKQKVDASDFLPLLDGEVNLMSDDSDYNHEDRTEGPVVSQEITSGPKLMIELEGNGETVSVSCTKKEDVPIKEHSKTDMSQRSTFLNNRRYTYDYFSQDNICRLCWSTTNTTKNVADDNIVAQKILEYIGVNIYYGTPKTVCSLCIIKVESFIKFKRSCLEADRKLKILFSNMSSCRVKLEKSDPLKIDSIDKERKFNIKMEGCSDFDDYSEEDSFNCVMCDIKFDCAEDMKKHTLEFHHVSSFDCYGCNKSFDCKLKLCKDTMEYSCNDCCKCVSKKKKFKVMKREEKPKVYKCQICGESFKVHLLFRKHMAQHRKEMRFVCETCGRVLKNKSGLAEHMLIHTNNKQLKCPHCDYRATIKTSLVYHIRLHTGERPYACDRCPYTCVTSSNLRRHINTTHLGIKAFKCQICSKEYMYKRSLKEHISSAHQGKKENMCKRCGALYFRFEHLRKHILVKHRKIIKKVKDDYFEVSDAGLMKNKIKMVMPSGS